MMDEYTKRRIIRELRRLAAEALNYDEASTKVKSLHIYFANHNLDDLASDTDVLCKEIINEGKYDEALTVIEQINCFGISGCGLCKLEAQELFDKYGIDVNDKWDGMIQYNLMKLKERYDSLFWSVEINCTWEEFREEVWEKVKKVEILENLESIYNSLFSLQLWYMEEKKMFPLGVIDRGMAGYNYEIKKFAEIDENGEIVKIWEEPQQKARETSENTPNLQEKAEKAETELKSYNNNSTRRKRGRPNRQNSSLKECAVSVDADKLLTVLHTLIDGKQAVDGVRYIVACIYGGLLERPTGGMIEKEFNHITASNYNKRKNEITENEKEERLKLIEKLLKGGNT